MVLTFGHIIKKSCFDFPNTPSLVFLLALLYQPYLICCCSRGKLHIRFVWTAVIAKVLLIWIAAHFGQASVVF